MCDEAVGIAPCSLAFVPDMSHVADYFKTQEMCIKSVEKEAESLEHVPNHFKAQEMCKRAIEADLYTLIFCPDWYVTQE